MDITINTETGNGRVKTMNGNVPHSIGFVGGDITLAKELGIDKHVATFWTDKIKAKFTADEAERVAENKASEKARLLAKKEKDDLAAQKVIDDEAAIQKRVDDAVEKALASQ